MPEISAGLMMYKGSGADLQVLLAHPGGPFWAKKDLGAWTIPKGVVQEGEDLLVAARREFTEETGIAPAEPFLPLGEVRMKSGKRVHAWAFTGACDPLAIISNTFQLEWPPRSGKMQSFAEIDRCAFFTVPEACEKILPYQLDFITRLATHLGAPHPG